jgi:hypothetical protein
MHSPTVVNTHCCVSVHSVFSYAQSVYTAKYNRLLLTTAQELWALRDDTDAQAALLAKHDVKSVLPRMVKIGYRELQLIYFFTGM